MFNKLLHSFQRFIFIFWRPLTTYSEYFPLFSMMHKLLLNVPHFLSAWFFFACLQIEPVPWLLGLKQMIQNIFVLILITVFATDANFPEVLFFYPQIFIEMQHSIFYKNINDIRNNKKMAIPLQFVLLCVNILCI